MVKDEQVVAGPLNALSTKEQKEVYRYRGPSRHKIAYGRRILQVENWIRRKGIVPKDHVVLYIMKAFDMERDPALKMFIDVKKDFQRIGKVYG